MSGSTDAIVIGGGIGGLAAGAYLKRAARNVLLLEASEALGGACRATTSVAGVRAPLGVHALYALDPRMVKELSLGSRGLKFAVRDMPLVGLRQDGRHLLLGRDPHQAARAVAAHSPADAQAYKRYQAELFALARALRPWWWEASHIAPALKNVAHRRLFARLEATSASAFLSGWFESEALKAALAFDARHPFEPGSALALVWRAAQEMCGLQGAVAVPQGGGAALADAMISAAQELGVEFRTRARVARLILADNAVAGVELDSGEKIFARTVLSSLSRRETLLKLAPTASAGLALTQALMRATPRAGEAAILFALNAAPSLGGSGIAAGARFVIAEHLSPDELVLEIVVPTAIEPALAAPGQHALSVRVKDLPISRSQDWSKQLTDRVVAQLERYTSHLRARLVGMDLRLSDASGTHLVESANTRIATPIGGLFLCGGDAEPVDAISGRAGRLAAGIAAAWLSREKPP